MSEPIHIISLGAGVQSSTMALMAAKGEIGPMPTCAVFADTGAEPDSVYKWVEWLEKQLSFPVVKVMQGEGLTEAALTVKTSGITGKTYLKTGIPSYYWPTTGIGSRQCTRDFKIAPINREIIRISGDRDAISWIGISIDEATRMKPSRHPRIKNIWPLIDLGMTRHDCLRWMKSNNLPVPPRSACFYCPYKSDHEWGRMKAEEPVEFQKAVDFELKLQSQAGKATAIKGTPFLHKSCKPLSEVDFSTEEERGQINLFENECEGMCGV